MKGGSLHSRHLLRKACRRRCPFETKDIVGTTVHVIDSLRAVKGLASVGVVRLGFHYPPIIDKSPRIKRVFSLVPMNNRNSNVPCVRRNPSLQLHAETGGIKVSEWTNYTFKLMDRSCEDLLLRHMSIQWARHRQTLLCVDPQTVCLSDCLAHTWPVTWTTKPPRLMTTPRVLSLSQLGCLHPTASALQAGDTSRHIGLPLSTARAYTHSRIRFSKKK